MWLSDDVSFYLGSGILAKTFQNFPPEVGSGIERFTPEHWSLTERSGAENEALEREISVSFTKRMMIFIKKDTCYLIIPCWGLKAADERRERRRRKRCPSRRSPGVRAASARGGLRAMDPRWSLLMQG